MLQLRSNTIVLFRRNSSQIHRNCSLRSSIVMMTMATFADDDDDDDLNKSISINADERTFVIYANFRAHFIKEHFLFS